MLFGDSACNHLLSCSLYTAGNTCFINAAVQCLRHTPGLALTVLPDLLTLQQASDSDPGTPKRSAADAGGRCSAPTHAQCVSLSLKVMWRV
jgi:ubiquitin C-terminal hydrolase